MRSNRKTIAIGRALHSYPKQGAVTGRNVGKIASIALRIQTSLGTTILFAAKICGFADVAQLVEQLIRNQ